MFESGRPVAHVARELAVHRETLRLWVRQAEADGGARNDRLTSAERERMKQLERGVRELRRANKIAARATRIRLKWLRPVADTQGHRGAASSRMEARRPGAGRVSRRRRDGRRTAYWRYSLTLPPRE